MTAATLASGKGHRDENFPVASKLIRPAARAPIMAYYRFLKEYRRLAGVWAIRTSAAQTTLDMAARQQQLQKGTVPVPDWTPQSDVRIANGIIQNANY